MFVKDVFKILTSPLFCHICYHQKIPLQNLQRKCGLSLFQNLLLKFHYIKIYKNFLKHSFCHIFRTFQQSWFILTNGLPVPCSLVNINFTL